LCAAIAGIAEIADIARDRGNQTHTAEGGGATRVSPNPTPNWDDLPPQPAQRRRGLGARLGFGGIHGEGGRPRLRAAIAGIAEIAEIADIADIARDRGNQTHTAEGGGATCAWLG
jgi:hypothetical protein